MQLYPQYRVVASFPTRRSSHLMLRPMVCDTSIAENHSFANASLACMRPCASNMPAGGMFDAQGLMQANEAFAKLWFSAMEVSQTIGRNIRWEERRVGKDATTRYWGYNCINRA